MSRSLADVLATRKKPKREVILSPWLESGTLNMLYAPSGKGKTFMSLCISLALATGTKFLGWASQTPRSVLYIDGEMGAELLARRLEGILNNYEQEQGERPDTSNFHFIVEDDFESRLVPNMSDPANFEYYNKQAEDKDVVIIDNLTSCTEFMDNKDNDFTRWRRLRQWMQPLRNAGKTILLVHHANKAGKQEGFADKERPMHVIMAIRDCKYRVETPAENYFELHFEKGRELRREDRQPLLVEQIYTEIATEGSINPRGEISLSANQSYPLLSWRSTPLIEVQKKVCSNLRARSSYPKPTYKELAYTLDVPWEEARRIWSLVDTDAATRKKANINKDKPKRAKTEDLEISLEGIET